MPAMRVATATLLFCATVAASADTQGADGGDVIYADISPSVVLIRASVEHPDGTLQSESGTGFVVSGDGLVVTASHVIPDTAPGDHLIIGGSLGPDTTTAPTLQLKLVTRSGKVDAATMRFVHPPANLRAVGLRSAPPKPGEPLFVLGYPLGLPQTHILDGTVSSLDHDDITTNALVNKGNSGGPVLDKHGCVIGVIYSGIESNEGGAVSGIKFAVPLSSIRDLLPATPTQTHASISPADVIHVSDKLSRMQETHALGGDTVTHYDDAIPARPGFVIEEIESIEKNSLNPPALPYPVPQISADGSKLLLSYSLLSGPIWDQRRGWIDMIIHSRQRKVGAARPATPLATCT